VQLATRTVHSPFLGFDLEILDGDQIIGPAVERGVWEEHETRLFRAHLAPGCKVVDLGANIGWYSTLAVLAGCEVHSFEPVPAIADVCERNLERAMKHGSGKATLHRCAAGAEKGSASIAVGDGNYGDNRVLDTGNGRPNDMGAGTMLEIAVERVDDLVQGPARVLKIDTQGSEFLALSGAKELLAASPELALLIEFWPYALRGAEPRELLELLVGQGITLGKATAAPYPMTPARILRQASTRDPVKGGLDLYGTRGLPFHVGGPTTRLRAMLRSFREH
jgi:FkbM family methyltransferase